MPLVAASCKAIRPPLFVRFTSSRLARSSFIFSSTPAVAAYWMGGLPSLFKKSTSAPLVRRNFRISVLLLSAA
ncbi:hypothetical protein BDV29DRAFT_171735 [Aspergillus leporis]|uniref:Uncharacterized protein n=1 Tax=Aspergillus leporis TaxID=41062 RepID=A0A5N5X4D1_9EURO|nr:hypothetical protein BDV29DRAFT_171735 [Aspergillus leporis]